MKPANNPRYAVPLVVLHWVMALLIVVAFAVGLKIWSLPLSPLRLKLILSHKSAGLTILLLLALRLLTRAATRVPPLPAHMSAGEQRLAHLGHLALYALMLAVPLSGWAMSSAYGIPVVFFGIAHLPDWVAADPALAENLKWLHRGLNLLLALTVSGHVLFALKHHFLDRDGMLHRMRLGGS
ncbi:MAG: cytochrome b [Paludibacterium sp.]|uniref:cytochrome b n=1 Tax=Paludibacterium sp. TaxID=1917523 RepID=UPI0025FB1258|nr:cytochrome b [Paludibacterium sp.]MBV8049450.1 cytochrome b [Paludibacterium sp.]MBV8645990.1 cytochrome b [Paludibacterium sp.]